MDTNLGLDFKIEKEVEHKIVEHGLLAMGEVNARIQAMETYSALTAFRGRDFPLLDEKLHYLSRYLAPEYQEERLDRIISIAGVPDIAYMAQTAEIDVRKLLRIRQSDACRQFRTWLTSMDDKPDEEIRQSLMSLKEHFASEFSGTSTKVIRLATTTGIGTLPGIGTVAGTVAGVLDSFLLDRILPRPGPVSFIKKLYPSVFDPYTVH